MYRILYVTSEKKINEMMLEYAKSLEIEMVDEVVVPRLENYEVDEEVAEQKISQLDMKLYDAVICRGGMEKVLRGFQNPPIQIPIIPVQFLGATTFNMMADVKNKHPEEFEKPEVKVWVLSHHPVYIDPYAMQVAFHAVVENKNVEKQTKAELFQSALKNKVDFLLCGPNNCLIAKQYGIHAYYNADVDETETINNTIRQAIEVIHSIQQQRERAKMIENIMDYCFEALLQTDPSGRVIYFNEEMRKLFECAPSELYGQYIWDLIPDLEMADIRRVIENRENIYSSMVEVRQKQRAIINLIPNIRNGKCEGAILYLYQKTKIDTLDMQLKQKSYERGLYARYHFEDIIGQSEMMETCRFRAKQFARHHANVLILGESGTGKELFAQSIHNFSLRKGNPFVAINCGALPESLLESELFGYVGGAFTGANSKGKKGLIEQADKGTIFLDEIGEMSPEGQVRLLRVLEERTITRIGDDRQIPVNVRIIAATNRNLYQEVQKGKFREDLYYRLNVLTLNIPPLRKRREDIELLVNHFLEKYSRENEKHVVLDAGAMEVLKNYPWRGNVRQLRNFCERLVIISDRRVIGRELLQSQIQEIYQQENEEIEETELSTLKSGTSTAESDMVVAERREQDEETERQRILAELKLCLGNRGETAKNLHMSRATLWRKMKKYGISV